VRLAHKAMAEFHQFTHELTALVDALARAHATAAGEGNEQRREPSGSVSYLADSVGSRRLAAAGRSTK
jgi:hypothetical protein